MKRPKLDNSKMVGIWSAAPTPLTDDMKVHVDDVKRMVDHHIRLGINGLFLAGTNGEGPWLPDSERHTLVKTVVKHVQGELIVAVQVTDNSSARIRDKIKFACEDGADIAVIAPPDFFLNDTLPNLKKHYLDAICESPLPVGIYDRGNFGNIYVNASVLKVIYAEENVVLIKDSSMNPEHAQTALAARKKRPGLKILNGNEFNCVEYLEMGYDGFLLGGGVFNGYLAGKILEAAKSGDLCLAHRLQKRMNRIMYAVYGGKKISCWLSGEKKLLVEMGILSTWKNFPNYPLTKSCIRAIERVLKNDADVLFPLKGK